MKAQSASEFIAGYGLIFLAIAVILALLLIWVLNKPHAVQSACQTIRCVNVSYNTTSISP